MPPRLSRRAGRDLDDIYGFGFERWGEKQADDYLAGFWDAVRFVEDFPLAQLMRHEVQPPIRAYNYKAHLILYDMKNKRLSSSAWHVLGPTGFNDPR